MACHGKLGERRRIPIGDRLFVSLDYSFFFGLVHELGKIRWICRNGVQWTQIINFSRRHSKQHASVIVAHYDKKLAVSERSHLQDLKLAFFFGAVAVQWDAEFNEINRRAGECSSKGNIAKQAPKLIHSRRCGCDRFLFSGCC